MTKLTGISDLTLYEVYLVHQGKVKRYETFALNKEEARKDAIRLYPEWLVTNINPIKKKK